MDFHAADPPRLKENRGDAVRRTNKAGRGLQRSCGGPGARHDHTEVILKTRLSGSPSAKPKTLWRLLSADGVEPNPSPAGPPQPLLKGICGY